MMEKIPIPESEIEKLAHENYPHGSLAPIGCKDRAEYERRKESFIAGFKAAYRLLYAPPAKDIKG